MSEINPIDFETSTNSTSTQHTLYLSKALKKTLEKEAHDEEVRLGQYLIHIIINRKYLKQALDILSK